MAESIRIALCQINPIVGDFTGNASKIVDAAHQAETAGAQVAMFPEMALCGFPPQDLLLRRDFMDAVDSALKDVASRLTGDCVAIVGVPFRSQANNLYDAAAVIRRGQVEVILAKGHLSNAGPLDELRYFVAAGEGVVGAGTTLEDSVIKVGDTTVMVGFGDEIATEPFLSRVRVSRPSLVLNPVVSMFHRGVQEEREHDVRAVARAVGAPVVLVNGVGGQDETIFDGGSIVMTADGEVLHRCERFVETVDLVDLRLGAAEPSESGTRDPESVETSDSVLVPAEPPGSGAPEELWRALVLGISDYVNKNGFAAVGLGLSGGVDSALVATLAVEALGAERVHVVLMPSRHSSAGSIEDATALAQNLGIDARTIAIEPAHAAFEEMLSESFAGMEADLTEENLQARVRGTTLMALSNKFGWLILVTGNKSESSVGYSTLYGDSAGGFAPIQDIDKQTVYELCRWYNGQRAESGSSAVIPEAILTKAPSAELRPGQRDDQSLPPYLELDPLIAAYIDKGEGAAELIAAGFDPESVERIAGLIDRAEYKRRQSPPGLVVSKRERGYRRLMPMTRRSL